MTSDPTLLGTVSELHRYPVKSLTGEQRDRLAVDERGVEGDRAWAVVDPDGKLGSGKSTRRFRRMDGLLALRARYESHPDVPVLTFPDGRTVRGDDPAVDEALSEHVGRPVTLRREGQVSHFDEGALHLVTTASLESIRGRTGSSVDPRRLRPNIVVRTEHGGFPEDGWAGRRLAVGPQVVVEIGYPMPRCVMLDLPTADLSPDDQLLRTVHAVNGGDLGVVAGVVRAGTVSVGDPVSLLP